MQRLYRWLRIDWTGHLTTTRRFLWEPIGYRRPHRR